MVVVHLVHADRGVDAGVVTLLIHPEGRLVALVDVQRTELPTIVYVRIAKDIIQVRQR